MGDFVDFNFLRFPNNARRRKQGICKALRNVYAPDRHPCVGEGRAEIRNNFHGIVRATTLRSHPVFEIGQMVHSVKLGADCPLAHNRARKTEGFLLSCSGCAPSLGRTPRVTIAECRFSSVL